LENLYRPDDPLISRPRARDIAKERGITLMELFREMAHEYDAAMTDPIRRAEFLRISEEMDERDAVPFRADPLIDLKDCDEEDNE
jgi:hypothetical protein